MSKKSKAERQQAHSVFLARRTIKEKSRPVSFASETVRAAAAFAVATCPDTAAGHADMPRPVLEKIATGRFPASGPQIGAVIKAATAMGWKPPEAAL